MPDWKDHEILSGTLDRARSSWSLSALSEYFQYAVLLGSAFRHAELRKTSRGCGECKICKVKVSTEGQCLALRAVLKFLAGAMRPNLFATGAREVRDLAITHQPQMFFATLSLLGSDGRRDAFSPLKMHTFASKHLFRHQWLLTRLVKPLACFSMITL